jgi:hypothetical protein
MTTEFFCFYLPNRLIQTSQTGQWYSDTFLFSIPWLHHRYLTNMMSMGSIDILQSVADGSFTREFDFELDSVFL